MTKRKQAQVTFWGVRGSIPSPGKSTSFFGGNTSCIQIETPQANLVFDAGTGIRNLGEKILGQKSNEVHLFLTHYHLDHIMGLPFFAPLYSSKFHVHIHGPRGVKKGIQKVFQTIFSPEFFPVTLSELHAKITFHEFKKSSVLIKDAQVNAFDVNHPGYTNGYVIHFENKKIVYMPDAECIHEHSHHKQNPAHYLKKISHQVDKADLLIHDAHYFKQDYTAHRGWGHSTWDSALNLAQSCGAKKLVLFHHAPDHDDKKILNEEKRIKLLAKKVKIIVAREGLTLKA